MSAMQERKEDVRIYIVAALFFFCIVAGGALLCLYMFQPESESESASWYPVVGIVLVGIPWIFWILTYIYKCCAYCCCRQTTNGRSVNRVQSSYTNTNSSASASTTGHVTRSTHSTENGDNSLLKTPNKDDQRHVHFGDVVVLGGSKNHETQIETDQNVEGNINSSAASASASASREDEAPPIVSVST